MTASTAQVSTEDTEQFRQEVRSWLMENLPKGWGTPEYVAPKSRKENHEQGKSWLMRLHAAGYTAFKYPVEYGGNDRPAWQQRIIAAEMGRTGTPAGPESNIGVVAPTVFNSGTEEQKKRFLPKILNGEESWVQGFSEPNAGSDLANIQTAGVRDGDDWIVNGQKVWNSLWEFADYGILVVKTNMEAPRHRNLSYFIFDCKSPGYSASPLRKMTGGSEFCEMFFDNVRIPHANMMGDQDMGWYAAMNTLVHERSGDGGVENLALPSGHGIGSIGGMTAAVDMAKNTKRRGKTLWEDDSYRQRIAECAIRGAAGGHSAARAMARLKRGIPVADEVNISKLFNAELEQDKAELMTDMLGEYGNLWKGAHSVSGGIHPMHMMTTRSMSIYAGTSEINRNIIAERILGLPRIK